MSDRAIRRLDPRHSTSARAGPRRAVCRHFSTLGAMLRTPASGAARADSPPTSSRRVRRPLDREYDDGDAGCAATRLDETSACARDRVRSRRPARRRVHRRRRGVEHVRAARPTEPSDLRFWVRGSSCERVARPRGVEHGRDVAVGRGAGARRTGRRRGRSGGDAGDFELDDALPRRQAAARARRVRRTHTRSRRSSCRRSSRRAGYAERPDAGSHVVCTITSIPASLDACLGRLPDDDHRPRAPTCRDCPSRRPRRTRIQRRDGDWCPASTSWHCARRPVGDRTPIRQPMFAVRRSRRDGHVRRRRRPAGRRAS